MATQNILPSLQADEKTAHLGVRSVHIPNGMLETGRMLTDAGQGLQRASFGLALGLKRQRDEMNAREDALALAEAKNAYSNDMTKHVTELMQKSGTEARGITGQFDTFSDNAFNRWQSGLSPRAAREFKIWADQQHLSGWQRVQGHELSNVKGAQVEQGNQGLTNDIQMFSVHGDYRTLAMLDQDARAQYELLYGGSGDQESLDRYTQNLIDKAYGARMQYLLEQGDVEGATRFFDSIGTNGMPSAGAAVMEAMRIPLMDKQRGLEAKFKANAALTHIMSSAGPRALGGQFMTEEMVNAVAEYRADLQRSTDPRSRALLVEFDAQWSAEQKRMAANRAAAQANVMRGLFRNPYDPDQCAKDLEELQSRINAMPPTVAREDAEDLYNSEFKSYLSLLNHVSESQKSAQAEQKRILEDRKKDPARQVLESYLVNNVACMAEPVFTIGSGEEYTEYDGKDRDKLSVFLERANMRNGGPLTDEAANQIWMICTQQFYAEPRRKAVARVGRLFQDMGLAGDYDPKLIAQAAPWLIDYAVNSAYRLSNDGKITGKDVENDIDKDVLLEMKRKFYVPRWDGYDFWDTASIIDKAIKADGTVDYQYLENAFGWPRYRTGRKAAGPKGPTGGLSDAETDKEIREERARRDFAIQGAMGGTGQDFYNRVGGVQ